MAEPITTKAIKEGKGKDYSYCMSEMQGIVLFIKDGERIWKMHQFVIKI